ncbi:MAG: CAP domain-containing protein [Patescibacteria group bacterium]|jgi:hypothetical protein
MKANKKQLILLGAAIAIGVGYLALSGVMRLGKAVQAEENPAAAQEIVQLTNTYRQSLELNDLSVNPRLTQAAIDRAKDILAKQYFGHISPDGKKFSDWVKDTGYKYFYVGENLAIDFNNSQEVFEAWLKSDGHRQNLERGEYQEIGVASLRGEFKNQPTSVVVQLFGSRVLGANELNLPNTAGADNYFPVARSWSIERVLMAIDFFRWWLNCLIVIIVLLLLLTFLQTPPKDKKIIQKKIIQKPSANLDRPKARIIKAKKITAKKPAKAKSNRPKSPGTKRKHQANGQADTSIRI